MEKYNKIWGLVDTNIGLYLYAIIKYVMHIEKERRISGKVISLELALSTLNMIAFMGESESDINQFVGKAKVKWDKMKRN